MYYKAFLDGKIVDALDGLQCVFFSPKSKDILFCKKQDGAYGFISGNGQGIWHVEGWPEFPDIVKDRVLGTITYEEIDQEEYKTLRALLDEGVEIPDPEPDPGDVETLEFVKTRKIAASKKALAAYLEEHPITSSAHGGKDGLYAVTEEKQNLMALNYTTYQIKKNAGMEAVLTWNETGKECDVWTESEFVQLIIEIETYVKPLVSAQQSMEMKIQTATTIQEVNAVEIIF